MLYSCTHLATVDVKGLNNKVVRDNKQFDQLLSSNY